MSIQLGPIVMPCRFCKAPPGDACEGMRDKFHGTRETDAKTASELIADPLPPALFDIDPKADAIAEAFMRRTASTKGKLP